MDRELSRWARLVEASSLSELNTSALAPGKEIAKILTAEKSIKSIKSIFMKYGWQPFGDGAYSVVFGNPNYPYILKIFDASDAAYERYVELARSHPENPYFPKFKGRIMNIAASYKVIRVEKLGPVSMDAFLYFQKMENDWLNGDTTMLNIDFVKALDLIDSLGFPSDTHDHNIMQRADGQLVLIDPVRNGD